MTRSILRSSTALALSLALAAPGPLAAQGAASEEACDAARLGASESKRALNQMLKTCREAGLIEPSQAQALRAQFDAGQGGEIELAQAEEAPAEETEGEAAEDPALLPVEEGGQAAAQDDAPEGDEGAIVVDQAPEAEVEEGLATENSVQAEEPAAVEGEAADAETEAEIVIEGGDDAAPEDGEAEVVVDDGGAVGNDGGIVVDQAPEAEVEEGLATEDSVEAEGDEAAAPEDGEAVVDIEDAEGGVVVDQAPEAEVEEGLATEDSAEIEADEDAPAAEAGEAVIDIEEAEEGTGDDGGIVVDQAPEAEVEEGLATEDSVQEDEAPEAEAAADAEAEDDPEQAADGAETRDEEAEDLGAALDEAARAEEDAEDADGDPAAEEEEADAGTRSEGEGDDGDLEAALEDAARADEDEADAAEADEDAAEMEVPQEDTEETAARASEAPAAAAAEADAEEAAPEEMEAQTLTEEDTRSSDEAFAEDDDDDDGGLSNFEKALLLGLGAATVGAVLSDGGRVVESTGDRVVVDRDGTLQVLKDDDELLRRPGATVSQQTYDDGSTLTVVEREDGSRVTTVRAANGQVLRRTRTLPDGTEVTLFDDTGEVAPVDVAELRGYETRDFVARDTDDLRAALAAVEPSGIDRSFSLQQIREIRAVRELMPQIDVQAVEFDTGSAVIRPTEAEELRDIGEAMAGLISENPDEVFLVEGHTDAVGSAASNLALSDRRAESVALALTEYFDVPPESMIAQGYGEANLKVQTADAERENRRATVRRITPLLRGAALQ